MCVRRGDEWLLEERAIDGAVCPPGGKIESGQNVYQLDMISIQTQCLRARGGATSPRRQR